MLLFFLVLTLGFIQCESRDRKASLVILPPLVLGYDELSFERDDGPVASPKPMPNQPSTKSGTRRTKEELNKLPEKKLEKQPERKSGKPSEKPPPVKPIVKRSKRGPLKPSVKKGKPLKNLARKNKMKMNKKARIEPITSKPFQPATRTVGRNISPSEKPVKRSQRKQPIKPPVKKGKPLKKVARQNKKKINKNSR